MTGGATPTNAGAHAFLMGSETQRTWDAKGVAYRARELMHVAHDKNTVECHSLVYDRRAPSGHGAKRLVEGGLVAEKRRRKRGNPLLPISSNMSVQQLEHQIVSNRAPMLSLESGRLERNA